MSDLSRRHLLAGSAMAAVAATLPKAAHAAAPQSGQQGPGFYRFKIGNYEVTAINDGTWYRKLDASFVRNAALPDVQKALADAFLPTDVVPIPFTTLVVNTGSKLIALDTGTGAALGAMMPQAGTFATNLAAAGIDPKSVDAIYISHFHPDHINGIKSKDGSLFFPNASINVPEAEWAFWMDDGNMTRAPEAAQFAFKNSRRIFGDVAGKVQRFVPGKEVEPGITSIAAPGHTPGHTAYSIANGNKSLLYVADATNNPWLFVRNPEWQAVFDADPNKATETRKMLLDRAAADKMLAHGYHWPFPASGYITKTAKGYELVPAMWSPNL
ncbi:MBL fold metallo-hydrolase [Pseudorhodoplanes sp.]|uniref:MBL fold metallo-hydrolase n=1 Tax=Pseudorhodoplanes sp. TaxID=1934341 RepID=UPI003D0E343E